VLMYHGMNRLEVNIGIHSIYWYCCCYQSKEVPTTGRLSRRSKNIAPPSPAIKSRGDLKRKRLSSRRGNAENTGSALAVLYENKIKSANKGSQLVPIRIPTDCRRPGLQTLHNIVYKKAKHALNICIRVLVWAIRMVSHRIYLLFPNQ
jgi:hypothetical protein